MRDAVGGSALLNIIVIFTSIIILLFAGILAYSKAYKIKNRIIEVIERHESYVVSDPAGTGKNMVELELDGDLKKSGYLVATKDQVKAKCGDNNLNKSEYLYCVYLKGDPNGIRTYEVVTYIHFDFPVIGNMLTFAVRGETKSLGKNYNY